MGVIYDLWEQQKPLQKKILGIGYSSKYLSNEDKNTLSYKLWYKMIHFCYGIGKSYDKERKGKKYECCNSWLDYQNFLRWYKSRIGTIQGNVKEFSMMLTRNVISISNTIYNPNNCAIVPKEICTYLQQEKHNPITGKSLADKYKKVITDDIYELLTEDFDNE
jgi:hypothetical protein